MLKKVTSADQYFNKFRPSRRSREKVTLSKVLPSKRSLHRSKLWYAIELFENASWGLGQPDLIVEQFMMGEVAGVVIRSDSAKLLMHCHLD
jgi:hypothetical protein